MNALGMTDADKELHTYIRMMAELEKQHGTCRRFGFKYDGIGSFLVQRGAFWPAQSLPRKYRPMPLRQCFHNAMRLVWRYPELRFVEGFALSAIPVHHAWCIDTQGNVIDPTWATATIKHGLTGRSYFGVCIPIHVIAEIALKRGTASIFYGHPRKIFESIAEFENELLNYQPIEGR